MPNIPQEFVPVYFCVETGLHVGNKAKQFIGPEWKRAEGTVFYYDTTPGSPTDTFYMLRPKRRENDD